ncbi:MAG TPA: DUF1800 domain-containing protein [Capsulimonadaceae bacterium]|nr:DUF1800 domain-containing protein [Capsulimonadaceae bacterium]
MAVNLPDSNYLDTAHLLARAGFGSPPDEIQAASRQGLSATTDRLLHYEEAPDTIDDDALIQKLMDSLPEQQKNALKDRMPVQVVKMWWVYRMLATQRPLQEKMTLFWHNHFTSADNGGNGDLVLRQNQLYRKHALGNFRTLALEVSRDPEMLRYLNGNQNYKAHPNENYGRELMELFTCGRVGPNGKPNYTEDDVKAAARAFSGWNLRATDFYFNPYQHDNMTKTYLDHTGNLNGDDIVNILVALPATGYYICRKLFRYFAYDDPEPAALDALVKTYFASGYDIRAIVGQILRSKAFYSDKARNALIKSPAQFVVGTIRMAGMAAAWAPPVDEIGPDSDTPAAPPVQVPPPGQGGGKARALFRAARRQGALGRLAYLAISLRNMGQDILNPPSVKGWDGGEMWINTDTIQARERFALALSTQPDLPLAQLASSREGQTRPVAFAQGDDSLGSLDSAKLVDSLLWQFGPLKVSDATRQTLTQFADSQRLPQPRLRGVLSLILGTPEYQVC